MTYETPDFLATLSRDAWAEGGEIMQIMASAEENASDTVYVEKEAGVEDLVRLTFSTLESNLSYCEDAAACAWYAKRGIIW